MTEIVADSSQISVFETCPMMWWYMYNEKITKTRIKYKSDDEPATPDEDEGFRKGAPLHMGTLGHFILEFYYRKYDISTSCEMGYAAAMTKDDFKEFELEAKYVEKVFRTMAIYAATYQMKGDFEIRDPNALEIGFSQLILEDKDFRFVLEGRIDIAEAWEGSVKFSVDHKTQSKAKRLYKRSTQFRNYAMVMNTNFFMVNYIRFTKSPTFERVLIPFTHLEHDFWKQELLLKFKAMAEFKYLMLNSNNNGLNSIMAEYKRRTSCSGSWGGECEYTDLCDQPNLNVLVNIKQQNYEPRKVFIPW